MVTKQNNGGKAMFSWFLQRGTLDLLISGPILCEKTLEMNNKMFGNPEFKASIGWLGKFKDCHGICQLQRREA